MSVPETDWPGESGTTYHYWVYPIGTVFHDKPGNYIYANSDQGLWHAVYIGQTGSLRDRLADHEKEACARRSGATHVHAHTSGAETARIAEETDLINRWNPVCNG